MKNFVQPGHNVTLIAHKDVKSGDGVVVGKLFGIATGDAATGRTLTIATDGVYHLPKKAGDAIPLGAFVFFDSASGEFSSAGAEKVAIAVEAAGTAETYVAAKLIGYVA